MRNLAFSYYSSGTKCTVAHYRKQHNYRMWRHQALRDPEVVPLGEVCSSTGGSCAISALLRPYQRKRRHKTSPRKLRNIRSNVIHRSSPGAWDERMCERKCPITNLFNPTQKKIEMFYITNQSTLRKSDQSEVAISGRLANQIARNEPIIIGWLPLRPRPNNIYSDRIVIGILAFWQSMTMFTCERCGK